MDSVQSVVLLVEDNESHALLTIRGLSQQNIDHKIIHVTDGQAALDYLYRRGVYTNRRLSPRPDLVLLDLRLPKIDGLDVLQEIKMMKIFGRSGSSADQFYGRTGHCASL